MKIDRNPWLINIMGHLRGKINGKLRMVVDCWRMAMKSQRVRYNRSMDGYNRKMGSKCRVANQIK